MRIIAGRLAGRNFNAPSGHRTHPMSEKARGAIFNMLGDIEGLKVLDAFAGTGALAFEALSRGARHAVLIDNDLNAVRICRENAEALGLGGRTAIIQAKLGSRGLIRKDAVYDLIFCDPPYNDPQLDTILNLGSRLSDNGLMIVSLPRSIPLESKWLTTAGMTLLKNKSYSEATIHILGKLKA